MDSLGARAVASLQRVLVNRCHTRSDPPWSGQLKETGGPKRHHLMPSKPASRDRRSYTTPPATPHLPPPPDSNRTRKPNSHAL